MKSIAKLRVLLLVTLIVVVMPQVPAWGDTTFVSGTIHFNTTWTPAGNPYLVIGGTRVDTNVVLTILPGVQMKFNSGIGLTVDGGLSASGTSTDSIIFTGNGVQWAGLNFSSACLQSLCILEYCTIEGVRGIAVRLDGASPSIVRCNIRNNSGVVTCGIQINGGSAPKILYSTIELNQTATGGFSVCGGGISIAPGASPEIRGNLIKDNSVYVWGYNNGASGGGICVSSDSAIIVDNTFVGNSANEVAGGGTGGAMAVNGASPLIACNLISGNGAGVCGGIVISGGSPLISCNTIAGNTGGGANGIYYVYGPCEGTPTTVLNNIYSNHDLVNSVFEVYSGLGTCILAMENNWWATTDPSQIDLLVYDFWDDPTLRKLDFIPFSASANTPPSDSIVVLIPNGGETWLYDEVHNLRWNPFCYTDNVKLEYSTDGGSHWRVITLNTRNFGLYVWKVPFAVSTTCRVRVSDASDGIPSDISDNNFTIRPSFVPGDANGSGSVNISDAVYLIAYIFSGGPAPVPLLSGDANCGGSVNISDAVYIIAYIFSGGPAPCA